CLHTEDALFSPQRPPHRHHPHQHNPGSGPLMSIRFRLLTETDVKAVLTMDDLVETMSAALQSYSSGDVTQPVRTVISMEGDHAFFGLMPAYVRGKTSANSGEAGSAYVGGDARP